MCDFCNSKEPTKEAWLKHLAYSPIVQVCEKCFQFLCLPIEEGEPDGTKNTPCTKENSGS